MLKFYKLIIINKNIDLTKILKNCPKGWNLYSSIYGKVTFLRIEGNANYPIRFIFIRNNEEIWGSVTEKGIHNNSYNGECTLFPSEDQRDWNKFSAPWYKKEKFNPKTLQPFDRVLVRNGDNYTWGATLFSHINNAIIYSYVCTYSYYKFCIPYNDETKHLVGTKDEAPEFYKYWED